MTSISRSSNSARRPFFGYSTQGTPEEYPGLDTLRGTPGGLGRSCTFGCLIRSQYSVGVRGTPQGLPSPPNRDSNGTFSSTLTRPSEARASARRPRNPPSIHPATPPSGPTSGILAHAPVARHPPAEHAYVVPKVGLHKAFFVGKAHPCCFARFLRPFHTVRSRGRIINVEKQIRRSIRVSGRSFGGHAPLESASAKR